MRRLCLDKQPKLGFLLASSPFRLSIPVSAMCIVRGSRCTTSTDFRHAAACILARSLARHARSQLRVGGASSAEKEKLVSSKYLKKSAVVPSESRVLAFKSTKQIRRVLYERSWVDPGHPGRNHAATDLSHNHILSITRFLQCSQHWV